MVPDPVEIAEDIWENWYWGKESWTNRDRDNPCADCPNRDDNHYWTPKNLHPQYCSSTRTGDAEVLIVGMEPSDANGAGSTRKSLYEENGEDWRPEDHIGEDIEPSLSAYLRSNPRSHTRTFLFYDNQNRLPSTFEHQLWEAGDYFYTNSKRCANTGDKDSVARDCCQHYLEAQIEAVDPSAVVPLGEVSHKSTIQALQQLGEEPECSGSSSMKHLTLNSYSTGKRSVLPAYHWGYFYSHPPGNIPKNIREEYQLGKRDIEDYYLILAEKIVLELN